MELEGFFKALKNGNLGNVVNYIEENKALLDAIDEVSHIYFTAFIVVDYPILCFHQCRMVINQCILLL